MHLAGPSLGLKDPSQFKSPSDSQMHCDKSRATHSSHRFATSKHAVATVQLAPGSRQPTLAASELHFSQGVAPASGVAVPELSFPHANAISPTMRIVRRIPP